MQERPLIGELLTGRGVISQEQLSSALQEQQRAGGLFCSVLIRLGYAQAQSVFPVLAGQLGVEYVRLSARAIPPELPALVPPRFAARYRIVPLSADGSSLTVAMAEPQDIRALDDIRLLTGYEITPVLSAEDEIAEAIRAHYGLGAAALESLDLERDRDGSRERVCPGAGTLDIGPQEDEAAIVAFVNQLLSEAVRQRATDIHLEPFDGNLRSRFRIDGILYDVVIPGASVYFYPRIVSRIKIMARLDIVERRLPQDGRIRIRIDSQELDLRVATMPMSFGEGVHLRILNSRYFLHLDKLGLLDDHLRLVEDVIRRQHGIIFVTGPTGSGKSTTLHAALSRLNSSERKIITIEDPIEYQISGINQVQISPQIDFGFARALRSVLRHDPDVVMVGEVRDRETAEIAIRSALTGHLVFSTLHTNDAAGAVTRLLDMGIEPYLLASSLECLIAQRLVRTICPDCRQRLSSRDESFPEVDLYEGAGCASCRFTGYRGRTGIYEIIPVTEWLCEKILKRASSHQIKEKAVSLGMQTLRQDGLRKASAGLTTVAEVLRVTQQEE